MTQRTLLALAAIAAAFAPGFVTAQSGQLGKADRLRESKLETYLARAQTALDRLDDELRDKHIDGAKVAAKELRQALAALEKTRRSHGSTSNFPFGGTTFGEVLPHAPQNTDLFQRLMKQQRKASDPETPTELFFGAPPKKGDAQNPIQTFLERQQKQAEAGDPEAPAGLFFGAPPEKADGQNPMQRFLEVQQNTNNENKRAPKKPHDVMAADDAPAAYRELELNGQTVIVPEKLLGGTGEVTQHGSQLVIQKDEK